MPASEDELVVSAKTGNVGAFDRLMLLHQDRVFSLAYRILQHEEDARDVQQETFIFAWRSLSRFRRDAAFSTWLHRITVNMCLSHKRRKKITVCNVPDDNVETRVSTSPVSCMEKIETAAIVRGVLAGLPDHYRVLVVLRDMEERPFEEIAAILGCSVESARSRLCKARRLLRDRLRPLLEES
ncbi:MAG: RNA polymerase sigma factor [Armatimonadetes bacterium]|nr:RNA polymerase sigma factor [Armatimonadota bacterium]